MLKQNLHDAIDSWSSSFLRPHIPPKLMTNSTIKRTEDDGAKLIYAKFMHGEKTGSFQFRPYDGNINNVITDVSQESLWLYSLSTEKIPDGFTSQKSDGGFIHTGKVQKCHTCRGQGRVTCKSCGGKVRWTEKFGDKYIDKVCSCGDGKQTCGECTGFGEVETVIVVKNNYRLFETKNSQYKGEVPEDKIKSITGAKLFEHVIDYPIDELKKMLVGGLNTTEFNELQTGVLDDLHDKINTDLFDKGVNTKLIHEQINTLFQSVPNAAQENKLLEKEVIPVRVMLRVEDAPVTQVDYSFKEKDYSLWVYGNENKVWHQGAPFSFNYKMIILLIVLLGIIGFAIFNAVGGNFAFLNSPPTQTEQVAQLTTAENSAVVNHNTQQNTTPVFVANETAPTITSTKSMSGSVGKLKAVYTLNWFSDGSISGTYNYPSRPNTVYELKGRDLGNGSIELIEYTGSNVSANCNLRLEGDVYIGHMNNTDGRQLDMVMYSENPTTEESSSSAENIYIINGDKVRFRSAPNLNDNTIIHSNLMKGEKVKAIEIISPENNAGEGFIKIEHSNTVGYVSFRFISRYIKPPFYIITTAAVKTEEAAKNQAAKLAQQGQLSGYLWIPDYASLSKAEFYSVYVGPFANQSECEQATENYRKQHPEAYGLLVSQEPKRVEIRGIGKVTVKNN